MKFACALAVAALLPTAAAAQQSLNTGSAPVQTFTAANASHVAGKGVGAQTATTLGALISVPIARAPGGSGLALQLQVDSAGGDTAALQVRIWDVLPSVGTTCEDNTAFVSNASDDSHLITPPFLLSALAAPTNTTGDAKTYASISWSPPLSFRNQDATTRTNNVYICLVATATFTPAAAAYYVTLSAAQD
jgi:hypothetical protein